MLNGMSTREAILEAIKRVGPLCDDCLSKVTGVHPRQQINQWCRKMVASNFISRDKGSCLKCRGDKLINRVGMKAIALSPSKTRREQTTGHPWYWEGNVQRRIVEHLEASGYAIVRAADTGSRESGKDIEARSVDGRTLWLSVKGYPEKSSNTQARHWFAETLFDLILYREQDSAVELGIGLPDDHKTYINLSKRVGWFKQLVPFRFYWVSESGVVRTE